MSDYGIKVSKSGKEVWSNTPTDFIMNSNWATIKILKEGSGSQAVNASSNATVTITHDSGFYPICLVYAELTPDSGRWYAKPFNLIATENTYISGNLDDTYANTSSMVFKIINTTGSSKTVSYYYYVIGETGK
jgi:hypothetical protein